MVFVSRSGFLDESFNAFRDGFGGRAEAELAEGGGDIVVFEAGAVF